jgi:multicomponent Na+:H+ antiporter subunit F
MIHWFPVIIAMAVCLIIVVIRIFIGPGAPTRLVAFDTANTLVVTSLILLAMLFNDVVFIDVAIVYALLSFAMTLYVAKYIQGDKF